MALKHPEALDDPLMTRIGQRWEEELHGDGGDSSLTTGKHKGRTKSTAPFHTVGGTRHVSDACNSEGRHTHTRRPHL